MSTAPVFGNSLVPAVFKVGLGLYLALIVYASASQATWTRRLGDASLSHFLVLLVIEALAGIAIGFVASFVFAAVQFAGELLDIQIGYSIVNIVSPGLVGPASLLSNFHYILFVLWFLGANGHYGIILAALESFRVIPLGAAVFSGGVASVFLHQVVTLFVLGVQIAAPILLALFLTNISLAVASRAVPQMNVFVVGLPVTLFVGLLLLSLIMPEIVTLMQTLQTTMDSALSDILIRLGGGSSG